LPNDAERGRFEHGQEIPVVPFKRARNRLVEHLEYDKTPMMLIYVMLIYAANSCAYDNAVGGRPANFLTENQA